MPLVYGVAHVQPSSMLKILQRQGHVMSVYFVDGQIAMCLTLLYLLLIQRESLRDLKASIFNTSGR